jgi:hypothetical protein
MSGTHVNLQDSKVQRGTSNTGWVEIESNVPTREHIYIENSGVNHDWTTDNVIYIRFPQQGDSVGGEEIVALLNPGDSFEANMSVDVRIAIRSSVNNGSWTFIESENIVRKGTRNYST